MPEPEAEPTDEPNVVVVMPARQAAATLGQTVADIPLEFVNEVILVDDSSTDETVRLARELPVEVVWHPHQVGYGGNQKTCYLEALQRVARLSLLAADVQDGVNQFRAFRMCVCWLRLCGSSDRWSFDLTKNFWPLASK